MGRSETKQVKNFSTASRFPVKRRRVSYLGPAAVIETTRIYLLITGTEHRKQFDRLGFVV